VYDFIRVKFGPMILTTASMLDVNRVEMRSLAGVERFMQLSVAFYDYDRHKARHYQNEYAMSLGRLWAGRYFVLPMTQIVSGEQLAAFDSVVSTRTLSSHHSCTRMRMTDVHSPTVLSYNCVPRLLCSRRWRVSAP
jgi:hypothetical protein